jgi:hypothetical protein
MNNSEYCVISKELLILLEWLVQNEEELKKIVSYSWGKGFSEFMEQKNMVSFDGEQIQDVIFEFFNLAEDYIKDMEKAEKKRKLQFDSLKKQISINTLDIYSYTPDVLSRIFETLAPLSKEQSSRSTGSNKELGGSSSEQKHLFKDAFYKQFLEEWDFTNATCH